MMRLHFRKVKSVGTVKPNNPGVTMEFRREITWYEEKQEEGVAWNGNNDSGKTNWLLLVKGPVVEKGQSFPVELTFPLTEKEWESIKSVIDAVRNTVKAKREKGAELERYIDVDFLRIGVTTPATDTGDGTAYLEFTKDGVTIRANFANAIDLEGFIKAGNILFTPASG